MVNCRMPCYVEPSELALGEHLEFRLTLLHWAEKHMLWAQAGCLGKYKHIKILSTYKIPKYLLRTAKIFLFPLHKQNRTKKIHWGKNK